ncbi:hypothetical protein R1sor_002536 [Riccia sorocarpa]|uniref:Myb/SANT-like DNA-binding domain-containing protein n=1 Tax=Riccia sorocarpa TaxID=122646 RepID=A0ABD3H558_9MARC
MGTVVLKIRDRTNLRDRNVWLWRSFDKLSAFVSHLKTILSLIVALTLFQGDRARKTLEGFEHEEDFWCSRQQRFNLEFARVRPTTQHNISWNVIDPPTEFCLQAKFPAGRFPLNPEEDNFDQGRVHHAAQFGAVPPTDGAGGSQPANRRRHSTCIVTKVIHKQWESSQVEALLECKKAEAEELESLVGREQIISAEMKWKRIHAAMLSKGVQADPSQLRNKWESTLGSYKKVKDWNIRSGVEPYASLSRADRKANNLPLEFPDRWFEILESFYAGRPSITPPCMAESMPGSSGLDLPASSPGAPAEDDRYYSSTDPTVRSNSGKLRKKNASKSANAIVDCLDRFTNSMSEAETKRQDRQAKRDEFEERRLQLMEDSDCRRVEFMQKQHSDMVEVFHSMAGAFVMMATHDR